MGRRLPDQRGGTLIRGRIGQLAVVGAPAFTVAAPSAPRDEVRRVTLQYAVAMPFTSIRSWLGIDATERQELAPLRETLETLDHLEPDRARWLAAFAYLLGRVAHADQHVSPEETRTMEMLVREEGALEQEQAMIVVQLAKASNLLFGGTANFLVAREFSQLATYDQKLALMRCLFVVSATDAAISLAEESEIHRIARELAIDQPDLTRLRVSHRQYLPGLRRE